MCESLKKTKNPVISYEKYIEAMGNRLEENGTTFIEDKRECRLCGCTQRNACIGGCYWISDDLCSQCYEQNKLISNYLNSLEIVVNADNTKESDKVLIENTPENRERVHYLLCMVNQEPYNPSSYTPGMDNFLKYCIEQCHGYLDITYLTSNFLDIERDKLSFNRTYNVWDFSV